MKFAQSCLTLCGPMDYTVYGILQVIILEWVAFPFSRGSSQPRDWTQVSHIAGDSLPAEKQGKPNNTGVGSLSLLQRIFPTQKSNQDLLHCRQIYILWNIIQPYKGMGFWYMLQHEWNLKYSAKWNKPDTKDKYCMIPLMWGTCAKLLQLFLTLCNPMDCCLSGSLCPYGTLQARILEWVAISFSRGSSQPRNQTRISYISCIGRRVLHH